MDHFDRRTVLGGCAAAASIGLAGVAFTQATEVAFTECAQGKLRGLRDKGVNVFRGVPYAGAVSGEHRFKAAPRPTKWTGVRDATSYGPPAIQPANGAMGVGEPAPSEDCLVLNIWAPEGGARRKPVMVYSHGGGFTTGSASNPLQDGTNLARDYDVVVVATNHRLGVLGYLYLDEFASGEYAGSGNRGIQDIALALKWIGRNIAAFGGDPDNVMIFGESGGGAKTSCLYAMPEAAPYFTTASIESGPGIRVTEPDAAAATTRQLLDHFGIPKQEWRRLLHIPASQLLDAQIVMSRAPGPRLYRPREGIAYSNPGAFGPVRDSTVLPSHPFDPHAPPISIRKPLLVGGNEDEEMFHARISGDYAAWSMDETALKQRMLQSYGPTAERIVAAYRSDRPGASPSDLWFAVQSDAFTIQGSTVIAERKAMQGGAPAYRYVFAFDQGQEVGTTGFRMGAMHSLDVAFKFNNMAAHLPGRPPLAGPRTDRFKAGRNMSSMWASFARSGKPSSAGQPEWPAYDVINRPTLYIDVDCHVVNDPYKSERLLWERLDRR